MESLIMEGRKDLEAIYDPPGPLHGLTLTQFACDPKFLYLPPLTCSDKVGYLR